MDDLMLHHCDQILKLRLCYSLNLSNWNTTKRTVFICSLQNDDCQLLTVLTNGATGRNPTFFKAFGHDDVFGLKSCIPEGGTTLEIHEDVPSEDGAGQATQENVLYVRLPEGHPVITAVDQPEGGPEQPCTSPDPTFSIEEAIVQAELIFEDEAADMDLGLAPESNGESLTNDSADAFDGIIDFDPCFEAPDLMLPEEPMAEAEPKDLVSQAVGSTKRTSPRNAVKKVVDNAAVEPSRPLRSAKPSSTEPVVIDITDDVGTSDVVPKVCSISNFRPRVSNSVCINYQHLL
jgi:hypothetical protein